MEKPHTIVDSHRNMLMVSKNLSDFQLENLRKWPFIFFENVKKISVSYNFVDSEDNFYQGYVEFDLEIENPKELASPIMYLEASTKMMFWSDTDVKIKINGELWKKTKQEKKLSNTKKTSRKKKTPASKSL